MTTSRNKKTASLPATPDELRELVRSMGIAETLVEFSGQIGRQRQSIYGALKNPKKYPRTHLRIRKALAA